MEEFNIRKQGFSVFSWSRKNPYGSTIINQSLTSNSSNLCVLAEFCRSMIAILRVSYSHLFLIIFAWSAKQVWSISYLITSLALYFHLTGFMLSLLRIQGLRPHWWSEAVQKLWQFLEYYIWDSIYNLYHIKDQRFLISKVSSQLQRLNVSLQFSMTHFWECWWWRKEQVYR